VAIKTRLKSIGTGWITPPETSLELIDSPIVAPIRTKAASGSARRPEAMVVGADSKPGSYFDNSNC